MDSGDVKAVVIGVIITLVSNVIYHRFLEPMWEKQ